MEEEKRTLTLKNSFRQRHCNFNDLNEIGKTILGECHWAPFKSGLRNGKREPIQLKLKKEILMHDGHFLHIWYETLEIVRAQRVTIIKLPPHITDNLQQLDLPELKSLKDYWCDIFLRSLRRQVPD